ncbi:MAG: transketolase [Desulfobacterales bacterium]|nr:transketolase [Desulfobacterales bacterium]
MPITDEELKILKENARQNRRDIIDITGWSGGAHIGGALSMVDMLTLLYYKVAHIDPSDPEKADRDRIIVSKGHGGVGYAAMLARRGYFDFELLREFNKFKSPFGMHLDSSKVRGVDVSTGSLGHGLPIALGLAMGARVQKKDWRTYCILGDGECNEGSVWEAAMAAAQFKATNLITFVDRNRLMIDGTTEEVMGIEPFADKWKAFGFTVKEVDGHSFPELMEAIDFAHTQTAAPVVIIANTVKGKGIDFMENEVKWHYGGLDTDLMEKAKQSVDRMYGMA